MKINLQILISIIFLVAVILIVVLISFFQLNQLRDANMEIQCCEGNQCTDTYYTQEDNLCHLVLCENSPFTNKQDCVYSGKGIALNAS